jgi:DNA-binding PadR family transcriptional regulator
MSNKKKKKYDEGGKNMALTVIQLYILRVLSSNREDYWFPDDIIERLQQSKNSPFQISNEIVTTNLRTLEKQELVYLDKLISPVPGISAHVSDKGVEIVKLCADFLSDFESTDSANSNQDDLGDNLDDDIDDNLVSKDLKLEQLFILGVLGKKEEDCPRTPEGILKKIHEIENLPFNLALKKVKNNLSQLLQHELIQILDSDSEHSPPKGIYITDAGLEILDTCKELLTDYEISGVNEDLSTGWKHYPIGKNIKKVFLLHGKETYAYEYPNINRKFNSSMLNDDNIFCVDGWSIFPPGEIDYKFILIQVILHQKPMGFIKGHSKAEVDKFRALAEQNGLAFYAKDESAKWKEPRWNVGFSVKGKFAELFNIDALIEDYQAYFKILGLKADFAVIDKLKDRRLEEFLSFNYSGGAKSIENNIITGLILGYPVETTIGYLIEDEEDE